MFVFIWYSCHLAAASGRIWQGWFWEPALLLGALGQEALKIFFHASNFLGQSITISSHFAVLGGGIGEWEEVLLSIHCCTQHSLILLYHILTHFELEQRDFDLFLVFGNTEILKMYH